MSNIYGECIHGNNLATCVKCKFGEDYSDIMVSSAGFVIYKPSNITPLAKAYYVKPMYWSEDINEAKKLSSFEDAKSIFDFEIGNGRMNLVIAPYISRTR